MCTFAIDDMSPNCETDKLNTIIVLFVITLAHITQAQAFSQQRFYQTTVQAEQKTTVPWSTRNSLQRTEIPEVKHSRRSCGSMLTKTKKVLCYF